MTVIRQAERNLKRENREHELGADNQHVINYLSAYLDGAKAQYKEDHGTESLDLLLNLKDNLVECIKSYSEQMDSLIHSVQAEAERFEADEE